MVDEIIVPGRPDNPGFLPGFLPGWLYEPIVCPPYCYNPGGGPPAPEPDPAPTTPPPTAPQPPEDDSAPEPEPPEDDPAPEPEPPVEEPPPDVVVSKPRLPTEGDIPFVGSVAFSTIWGAAPSPRPTPRRRPVRRPKKPPPKTRPRRPAPRPGPRVRPQLPPASSPAGALLRFARGVLGRVFGGVGGVLYPSDIGGEPPTGDPIYGGFYGDDENNPAAQFDRDARRVLDPGFDVESRARRITPNPFVSPGLPTIDYSPFAQPGVEPRPLSGDQGVQPDPAAEPGPRPKPVVNPKPSPGVAYDPNPLPNPLEVPAPSPRPNPQPNPKPNPTTALPPTFFGAPSAPSKPLTPNKPGVLHLPQPTSTPMEELDKCNCPKTKKKRKEPKERDVCYTGSYKEKRRGLSKTPRRKIPCL